MNKVLGYLTHAFTASGTLFGLLALHLIDQSQYQWAFAAMFLTILIDAVDGTIARRINIKETIKHIDGATLDNIVDFFTYSMVPCYFLLRSDVIPAPLNYVAVACIAMASCYQFTQTDAKTDDHFFKGFPSYWNIVVFYLYYWQLDYRFNLGAVVLLALLSFVPIKFVYPSRLEYVSTSPAVRMLIFVLTVVWGFGSLGLIYTYPESFPLLNLLSVSYVVFYGAFSLYRTLVPIK